MEKNSNKTCEQFSGKYVSLAELTQVKDKLMS